MWHFRAVLVRGKATREKQKSTEKRNSGIVQRKQQKKR